jgi:signal transduction histidine kinase
VQKPPSGEKAMNARQRSLRRREVAVGAREDSVGLREEAVGAGEEAVQARLEVEQLNVQLREANERLIVATVRAQTAEEHAEHANRLKDDFLATVSHELRTPLNAVLGFARMLMSKELTTERAAHAIETIERNAASLAHIIDDLLDVSRIIAGTLHMKPQPVDLVAATQTALDVVKPLAVDKHIELRFSPEPGSSALVSGDGGRLQQVIWNLLANAIKFTSERGGVDVSVERVGSSIEVNVVDTGEGISAEFLPHVFEPFARLTGLRRGVTTAWVSGSPSSVSSWSCMEEPCTPPVKALDEEPRSPFVCRSSPPTLTQSERLGSWSDGPQGLRSLQHHARSVSTTCAS